MSATVTLTVVAGPHQGQELVCADRALLTIGRSEECTFPLHGSFEDMLISRRHCLMSVRADRVEIRDLESRNGTFVDGRRLGFPRIDAKPDSAVTLRERLRDG